VAWIFVAALGSSESAPAEPRTRAPRVAWVATAGERSATVLAARNFVGDAVTAERPRGHVFPTLATKRGGVGDERAASLPIPTRPPWWRTGWFHTLAILSAAAVLLTGHRLRTSGIEARNARLEQEMREREGAQRASQSELRLITDALPFVIAYVDVQDRIRFVNRAAEQWAGRPRAEVEGREIADLLPPAVFAVVRERLEMAQGGERVTFDFAVGADPLSRRRIAATLVPHSDGDGVRMGFYAFAEDITERVRTQEELHRQHDQLAHALRLSTLGEMATALAHELNQPLTAVLSNANAVLRLYAPPHGPLPDEVEETLHDIAGDATRAGEIIRRLRDLIRKGDSRKTPFDVNQAIRGVEALIRAAALENDVALFMDLTPALAMSVGDAIQVQQVVLNLVGNAIDAMRPLPNPERRLVVRSLCDRDMIVVSVEDSGPPIDKDVLARLFVPFYTSKPNGLGMGLAISRSIIEAHGGAIDARSCSGRGLAVRFTLRATEKAAGAVGPRMSA
jgi:PAS domain S-box-containing protein